MMYRFWILPLCLLLVACEPPPRGTEQVYPWQITLLANGNTRVFGIEIGVTSLQQASALLGQRYEPALFRRADGSLSLEVYFDEVTLGGLSGKLILTLAAAPEQLEAMRAAAARVSRGESGVLRYTPNLADQALLRNLPISSLGYIPYASLDEELVLQRFGPPARIVPLDAQRRHYLYPEKGLDLLLDDKGREFLQYVAPRDFAKLQQPLTESKSEALGARF